jgi:hypothetical protein
MAKTKNYSDPQFIVRQAKDGKSWSVFCELGYRRPIEIPDFSSEAAAQYWIDAVSKKWLEKFAARPAISDRKRTGRIPPRLLALTNCRDLKKYFMGGMPVPQVL